MKDNGLIQRIKLISGARWSQQKRLWDIPDTRENRERFQIAQKQDTLLSRAGQEHLNHFIRWLSSKRYSSNTTKTYSDALKSFLVYYQNKDICELTNEDVLNFNTDYILKRKLSASYQNQVISAIKLYISTVRKTKIEVDKIDRPKKPKTIL